MRGSAANARAAAVMRPAAANAITAWMTKNGRTPANDCRSQRSASSRQRSPTAMLRNLSRHSSADPSASAGISAPPGNAICAS
jgi:hypothetical protein